MTFSISRRRAMTASAVAALAALLPWRACLSREVARDAIAHNAVARDAIGIFRDRSAAAAIGDAYLAQHPDDRDAPRLLRRLFGDDLAQATAGIGREDLHVRLRRQLRQDFAEGRTVLVDGWLLAETEARLCALAALA
jgi:hypothetical protein